MRESFDKLLAQSEQFEGYKPWFAEDLNNAKLNSIATYYDLVPAIDQLLARNNDDLLLFYSAVEALTKLSESERHKKLTGQGQTW